MHNAIGTLPGKNDSVCARAWGTDILATNSNIQTINTQSTIQTHNQPYKHPTQPDTMTSEVNFADDERIIVTIVGGKIEVIHFYSENENEQYSGTFESKYMIDSDSYISVREKRENNDIVHRDIPVTVDFWQIFN